MSSQVPRTATTNLLTVGLALITIGCALLAVSFAQHRSTPLLVSAIVCEVLGVTIVGAAFGAQNRGRPAKSNTDSPARR